MGVSVALSDAGCYFDSSGIVGSIADRLRKPDLLLRARSDVRLYFGALSGNDDAKLANDKSSLIGCC